MATSSSATIKDGISWNGMMEVLMRLPRLELAPSDLTPSQRVSDSAHLIASAIAEWALDTRVRKRMGDWRTPKRAKVPTLCEMTALAMGESRRAVWDEIVAAATDSRETQA